MAKATLGLLQVDLALSAADEEVTDKAERIEHLSAEHTYPDLLAQLRLIQGHSAWRGDVPDWRSGFDAALYYYQQGLTNALHYNRFLLDEVLWGGDIATSVPPIIPRCLMQGGEGQQMLSTLRDWWLTGSDDLSPEHIGLREAERLAREREPGDGSPQVTVVQQVEKETGGS